MTRYVLGVIDWIGVFIRQPFSVFNMMENCFRIVDVFRGVDSTFLWQILAVAVLICTLIR